MREHLEYMEREFPHDPTKYVEPPELTPEDERILDDVWASMRDDRKARDPAPADEFPRS